MNFYSLETGNGIVAEEHGQFKPGAKEDEGAEQVQGSFQYTADDGTPVRIQYVADENGYQPQGDILPVAPAIPPAIARALEYIAAHPEPEEQAKKAWKETFCKFVMIFVRFMYIPIL